MICCPFKCAKKVKKLVLLIVGVKLIKKALCCS